MLDSQAGPGARAETAGGEDRHIAAVRHFTRFYTQRLGVLERKLLHSPFSLSEARVLYEIAHQEGTSAAALGADLRLDAGYLSRMLNGLARCGLIAKHPSGADGRRQNLHLTPEGKAAFSVLNERSHSQTASMLAPLSGPRRDSLAAAMGTIEDLLGTAPPRRAPYILRPHRPGDMGWIVQCHATLYTQNYGWDESFEALVADIAAKFLRGFDPAKACCWIAERDGANAGSAMLVEDSPGTARLRLVIVEPSAHGLGMGRRLVEECLAFARRAGYRKVTLWTNDILHAARRIYQAAGFHLVEESPHHSFGKDLVGQTWDLDL